MRYIIFVTSLILMPFFNAFSQTPDSIRLKLKDTLSDLKDCVIEIELSDKSGKAFLFPSNYIIYNEADLLADLQIIIQRMNGNEFRGYLCDYASVCNDALKTDSLLLKKYKNLVLVDSLPSVTCIGRGSYRMKVVYNKRPVSGDVDDINIVAESNWVYFYVKSDEIDLRRYWPGKKQTE